MMIRVWFFNNNKIIPNQIGINKILSFTIATGKEVISDCRFCEDEDEDKTAEHVLCECDY